MTRLSLVGIAIGALGAMITLMGLFPGITGLQATVGVGVVQTFSILIGFSLLIMGAVFYVRFAFYLNRPMTLMQQIGNRLALTGIVLAWLAGLADAFGFGSHGIAGPTGDAFLGPLQALAIIGSYVMSCVGVLIYAIGGNPSSDDFETTELEQRVPD